MDNNAAPRNPRWEEVPQDRVVDLPALQNVEKEDVDRPARPADLSDIAFTDDVGDRKFHDVRIEAMAERLPVANRSVILEELRNRISLDAKEVVAGDRWPSPRDRPIANPRKQRGGRTAEKTSGVDNRRVLGSIVTRKRVEESALFAGEHRRNSRDTCREAFVLPGPGQEISEPIERLRRHSVSEQRGCDSPACASETPRPTCLAADRRESPVGFETCSHVSDE